MAAPARSALHCAAVSVIDEILASTSVESTVFGRLSMPGPWGMAFDAGSKAGFHMVARGEAWLREPSLDAPLRVQAGEVVLLGHGSGHALLSHRDGLAVPFMSIVESCRARPVEDPRDTLLLCGAYRIRDSMKHPLLSLLPPVVHLEIAHHPTLATLLSLLESERAARGFGSESTVTKLVDIMFIHLVRAWLERAPATTASWLEATRDPRIVTVLSAVHRRPSADWTLDGLADLASMSRAAFVRRFRALTGEAPLTYLTRWRMAQAERLLRDTSLSVAEIASRVGYGSEFAFSKAFRRTRGLAPTSFRKQQASAAA